MIYLFQVMAILYLFILGGRRGILNLECLLKFVTGSKKTISRFQAPTDFTFYRD